METERKREKELENESDPEDVHQDLVTLNTGTLKQKDDVKRVWERGTEGLVGLWKVPSVLASLERADKAVEVVKGM